MLQAVKHVRLMRGGAQSHLMRADDGRYYVVKFLNNPQHSRILANEWLGSKIAAALGLSVPVADVMHVGADFVAATPELVVQCGGRRTPVSCGPAFASRLPIPKADNPVYDYLPEAALELVENLDHFVGILAVDKWLCNCDGRQVIFCRPKVRSRLQAFFVDFGFCFNAGDWTFPDSPTRSAYHRDAVYQRVTGWKSFEPWLSAIESFSEGSLLKIALDMPEEWAPDRSRLLELLDQVLTRRQRVRHLVETFRLSPRAPFKHWPAASFAATA